MTTFASRLKAFMDEMRFNQTKLAEELGYSSPEKLSRLFRKENALPSFDIIADLSNKFDKLNVRWLVTGVGEMFENEKAPEKGQARNDYLIELNNRLTKIDILETTLEIHSAKLYAIEEFLLAMAMEVRGTDRKPQSVILGKLEGAGYRLGSGTYSALNENEGKLHTKKSKKT